MSLNIRLFVLLGVFGAFVHQSAIGQSVPPAVSSRGANQGAVSEKVEQGLIRLDGGVASPIDNILGSGIKLPSREAVVQPTSAPTAIPTPAVVPATVPPVTEDAYGK